MVQETILQHWVVTQFMLPFLFAFVIFYAILAKTKLLGENQQVNAILAFVIGLIFVSAVSPKLIVENLLLFLTVAITIVFVVMLLLGFASGSDMSKDFLSNGFKAPVIIAIIIAVTIAVLWATGTQSIVWTYLFGQSWSGDLWTNVAFVVVIAGAIAIVLGGKAK